MIWSSSIRLDLPVRGRRRHVMAPSSTSVSVSIARYRTHNAGGYAVALSYVSPILSLGMSGLCPWKNVAWTSNARRSHAKEAMLMVETVESSDDELLMPCIQFDIETLRNPCSRLTPCCMPKRRALCCRCIRTVTNSSFER